MACTCFMSNPGRTRRPNGNSMANNRLIFAKVHRAICSGGGATEENCFCLPSHSPTLTLACSIAKEVSQRTALTIVSTRSTCQRSLCHADVSIRDEPIDHSIYNDQVLKCKALALLFLLSRSGNECECKSAKVALYLYSIRRTPPVNPRAPPAIILRSKATVPVASLR